MTAAIVAVDLVKRYADGARRREVVSGISLEVAEKTVVALVGPSGSGKTTLLGMLGGLILPTSGSVSLFGGPSLATLREHHRTRARRAHVGYVLQDLALVAGMTVRENVALPLVPTGGPTRADDAHIDALLAKSGIASLAATDVARLSGGEKQRAAIARALVTRPKLLLLDEPTAHLDAERAKELTDVLFTLREDGATVVIATHDARISTDARVDRVLQMEDGKLRDPLPPRSSE